MDNYKAYKQHQHLQQQEPFDAIIETDVHYLHTSIFFNSLKDFFNFFITWKHFFLLGNIYATRGEI
jgi:hypothetical protein